MPANYSPEQIRLAFKAARSSTDIKAMCDLFRHVPVGLAATVCEIVEHGEPSDWQAVLDGDVGVITMQRRLWARRAEV